MTAVRNNELKRPSLLEQEFQFFTSQAIILCNPCHKLIQLHLYTHFLAPNTPSEWLF